MNKKTLKALEGSIEKWRKIVAKKGVDLGPNNCPLCKEFIDPSDCDGCPVKESVGARYCKKSPYSSWEAHQDRKHRDQIEYKIHCGTCTRIARAELKFLESLRP